MSTPSIPSSHSAAHVPDPTGGEHPSTDPSHPAPASTTPTPTQQGSAQLSTLGKLKAKLSKGAKKTGEGIAAIESPLGTTASGGYLGWGVNNAASSGGGLASAAGHASEGTKNLAEVAGSLGAVPQALDIVATSVSTAHKAFKVANSANKVKTTEKGTLDGDEARRALAQDKGNLQRAAPGAFRDVGLGALNMTSRMESVTHPGTSLYGKAPGPVYADGALAIASGAMYTAAGALQSRAVDRKVQRTHAFSTALDHPASAREDATSPGLQELDDLHERGRIDSNVYSILRQRSDAEVTKFTQNFASVGGGGQQRLNQMLHFPGERIKLNVLNFNRKTNLNTASTRRAIREDVIDAFIAADVRPGRTDSLFTHLATVREESRGKRAGPDLGKLDAHFATHGVQKSEFDKNALTAIARSGNPDAFLERYKGLSETDRSRVRDTMHFGSWRFWKSDATLPTTKYQRGDIRQALAKHFIGGATIERMQELKTRYNAKVVPLKPTGTTPQTAAPPEMLKQHLSAYQALNLDNLKEEKRHAKVQVAYGAVNMAAGVAELAVNPVAAATAGQVSASRAVLSPVYLIYAGRRGIVSYITQKNARPIDAKMREEALLRALPRVRERIESGAASTQRLQHRDMFLRNELKLGDADIKKLDGLERAGNHAGAREFLASKNPENNVLVALRVMADERGGVASHFHRNQARQTIDAEAQTHDSAALRAIDDDSNPDESFAALKTHFLDEAAYHPAVGIGTLSEQLATGHAQGDFGFDKTGYQGKTPAAIAEHLKTRFAQDNPPFAVRQFVAGWRDGGEGAVAARNMLRDLRFTEKDIAGLEGMSRKDACKWLEGHLFGENVRRRFSTVKLDQAGRNLAADAVERVQVQRSDAAEPLQWRNHFEEAGVDVIDNPGTPGLDSMLYALHQNISGKSDASSSEMNKQVMKARAQVIQTLRRGQGAGTATAPGGGAPPLLPVDVAQHADVIARVAAQVYGKPGAAVKLVDATGAQPHRRIGGDGNADAPVAAVLCYDSQSKRTFTLHGGKPAPAPAVSPPASGFRPLQNAGGSGLDPNATGAIEMQPMAALPSGSSSSLPGPRPMPMASPQKRPSVTASGAPPNPLPASTITPATPKPLKPSVSASVSQPLNAPPPSTTPQTPTPNLNTVPASSASGAASSSSSAAAPVSSSEPEREAHDDRINAALSALKALPQSAPAITPWSKLPGEMKAVYGNKQWEYEQQATMAATDFAPTQASLEKSGFSVVKNNGDMNNCLLISMVQHATGDYSQPHTQRVNEYRQKLVDEGHIRNGQPMTFTGAAGKRLVAMINDDPRTRQPLHVVGVTQVAGRTHLDHIGADQQAANVREVMIWDQGGHFEAVKPKDQPAV
ncbi:hypothetical protein [Paraburkholderia bryophila]|uniref:Uncharacterized protein n=1 Tax=Paraburkholderia bryophila TaxID=420952 RepID=A0A329CXW0_9BURK|nr:hypothetical protein [Paraburkholderia bryophila]RAS39218.1 hypothetical protein BX591_101555 [Paraburkholderia bryophila]